ncbi:MAG: ribbon-helix-helix protein, CopG family [Planctomycetes bacterium]|nr:ribbon-helix-helix protein, CopG family [Planctomycetota bacterium]
MRTVQMTLEETLVEDVDRAVRKLRTTRSAFAREALRAALDRLKVRENEKKHKEGYKRKPARKGEFERWHREQVWPDL